MSELQETRNEIMNVKNSQQRPKTQKKIHRPEKKREKKKRFKDTIEENFTKMKENLNFQIKRAYGGLW